MRERRGGTAGSGSRVVRSRVEPKLVERRQRVEAADRRRRRRRLAVLAAVVATPLAVTALALSPALGVRDIQVTGLERLSEERIVRASGIELGDNMVDTDLVEVRRAAMKDPMVASATVVRRWPATVRIEVVEEQPVAMVHDGDRPVAVVSRTGRILDPVAFDDVELPAVGLEGGDRLKVGDDLDERIRSALRVFEVLPDEVAGRLDKGTVTSDGLVGLELAGGIAVRFGNMDEVPAKVLALATVLDQVSAECMDVLDVSEPERPTVTRAAGCTPSPVTSPSPESPEGDDGAGADSATAGDH